MKKYLATLFILIMGISQSCRLQEEEDVSKLEGASTAQYPTCNYSEVQTISLENSNPHFDFLAFTSTTNGATSNGVKVIKQTTGSSCEYIRDQSVSERFNFVSRIGNSLTIGHNNSNKAGTDILNFTIFGDKLDYWTTSSCNANGLQKDKTLFSSHLDEENNKIIITYSYKLTLNQCKFFDDISYLPNTILEGTWSYACSDGKQTQFSFFENSVIKLTFYHIASDCSGFPFMRERESGTYRINGFLLSNSNKLLGKLDLNFHKFTIIIDESPIAPADLDAFRANEVCEIHSSTNIDPLDPTNYWSNLSPIDVTNRKCKLGNITPKANYQNFTSYQRERYDVIYIKDNTLKFGDINTGGKVKEDDRPVALDEDNILTKKAGYPPLPMWSRSI